MDPGYAHSLRSSTHPCRSLAPLAPLASLGNTLHSLTPFVQLTRATTNPLPRVGVQKHQRCSIGYGLIAR